MTVFHKYFHRYVQETIGLHELAPQYRQFYSIFESFKISDQKADIAPPMLATPTSLSSKAIMANDDLLEDIEDPDDVSCKEIKRNPLTYFNFRKNWKTSRSCPREK